MKPRHCHDMADAGDLEGGIGFVIEVPPVTQQEGFGERSGIIREMLFNDTQDLRTPDGALGEPFLLGYLAQLGVAFLIGKEEGSLALVVGV